MSQDDFSGYTVAYEQEEIQFPVFAVMAIAGAFFAGALAVDSRSLFALGLGALGYAYHNVPLLETGRPRIGAGQYGIFVEGLGIISWRSVADIELRPIETRGTRSFEMLISLSIPLERALIADWRRRPWYRYLMRLPYTLKDGLTIRIPLDIMDKPAADIHHAFQRMMRFYCR